MIRYVFDVATALRTGTRSASGPLPASTAGFVTLRTPPGLSMETLRDSPAGKDLLWQQEWYLPFGWFREPLPAGTYLLRVPVPLSEYRNTREQEELLRSEGESLAPAVLAAAAFLCLATAGVRPFAGWARCANAVAPGYWVELAWHDGRLLVAEGGDIVRHPHVRAASVRLT